MREILELTQLESQTELDRDLDPTWGQGTSQQVLAQHDSIPNKLDKSQKQSILLLVSGSFSESSHEQPTCSIVYAPGHS